MTELTQPDKCTKTLKRPRLMYLITCAVHGGAQAHVLDLVRGFRDEFEVSVATGEEGFLTEACRAESVPTHIIPHLLRDIRPYSDTRALIETLRLLKRERPDLIHAHTWKAGFVGRLAARLIDVPSIYTVHMWHFEPSMPRTWRVFGSGLERAASRWSARTINVSISGSEFARRRRITEPSRMITVHNGIADVPRKVARRDNPVPTVAMVARFSPFKDHETMIRAFANLNVPAHLKLIGDGPTRASTEQLAMELGLRDRVEFMGDRADVEQLLHRADVFALATKNENLPISILEAMRASLPVIASDVGGIPEVVLHGKTGFLVPPRSESHLTEVLSDLIVNKELRIRMGLAGRARYETFFSLGGMVERTREVYRDVLAEARSSH